MKSFLSIFFLLNTILSSINFLSTKSTTSALAPFIIVVVIGLVLDGIEEIKRYRNDVKANNTKVKIYKNKKLRNAEWSKVKIGNLVKVKKDENFPADMLVIFSSNKEGNFYLLFCHFHNEFVHLQNEILIASRFETNCRNQFLVLFLVQFLV